MKVVLVPASTEPVGVAAHVLSLARLLGEHGMLDVVVVPRAGWLTARLEDARLPWAVVPFSHRPAGALASSVRLLRFLRRRSAQVVHVHGRLPLLVSALSMLALRRRTRFVATVHEFAGIRPDGALGCKRRVETWLLRRVTGVACVSRDLRADVVRRLGAGYHDRVAYLPNWLERRRGGPGLGRPRPERGAGEGARRPFRLCAAGRLSPEKGFEVLVDAVALLAGAGRDVVCDIYGAGSEETALAARIARRGLGARVTLRGAVDDLLARLAEHDAVVIPSRSEAFGLVALEAYEAGVAVVASDLPGLREVVQRDRTGLLVPAGDPAALADAIAQVAASPGLAGALVRGGRAFLADQTPTAALAERYRALYAGDRGGGPDPLTSAVEPGKGTLP